MSAPSFHARSATEEHVGDAKSEEQPLLSSMELRAGSEPTAENLEKKRCGGEIRGSPWRDGYLVR